MADMIIYAFAMLPRKKLTPSFSHQEVNEEQVAGRRKLSFFHLGSQE